MYIINTMVATLGSIKIKKCLVELDLVLGLRQGLFSAIPH